MGIYQRTEETVRRAGMHRHPRCALRCGDRSLQNRYTPTGSGRETERIGAPTHRWVWATRPLVSQQR